MGNIHGKSATLYYINLAFIPHDCDVAPNKDRPLVPKNSPPLAPPKNPRTATGSPFVAKVLNCQMLQLPHALLLAYIVSLILIGCEFQNLHNSLSCCYCCQFDV